MSRFGTLLHDGLEKAAKFLYSSTLQSREANLLVRKFDFAAADIERSSDLTTRKGPIEISSVNWFIPSFENVFAGGIRTVLLLAEHLQRHKQVRARIVVVGDGDSDAIKHRIRGAFSDLGDCIFTVRGTEDLEELPYADAAVCTLWSTAYSLLKFNKTKRKFYLIQDYEPAFYAAGSISALAEATYRFGFYALVNSPSLKEMYSRHYGGQAHNFAPCIDTGIFHRSSDPRAAGPFTLFFYARPKMPRNCFELACEALRRFKKWGGDGVKILAAGARWDPADFGLKAVLDQMGMLNYVETGDVYRACDAGLVLMTTWSPSYVQLELMASGCLLVTNRNPHLEWLFRNEENCLLADLSVSSIFDTLRKACVQRNLRDEIVRRALTMIERSRSDWTKEIDGIFEYMCDPGNSA